jgi:hypothetical protein
MNKYILKDIQFNKKRMKKMTISKETLKKMNKKVGDKFSGNLKPELKPGMNVDGTPFVEERDNPKRYTNIGEYLTAKKSNTPEKISYGETPVPASAIKY